MESKKESERIEYHIFYTSVETCHHAHNAANAFCKPFSSHVESLLKDLHTDFKWSPENREHFHQLCSLLGITPSSPMQYAPHRWLSVLHVSVDTVRLINALTVYYSSYLQPSSHKIYREYVKEAQRCYDNPALKDLIKLIASKSKSTTADGKERKARICDKLFTLRFQILSILNVYVPVCPI